MNPYPVAGDEELVVRTLTGERAAYDELVRRFRPGVVLVAEQVLGSRFAAEDVAQDALLQAYRALPMLAEPAKFAAWLRAIARHRALRVATGQRRMAAADPELLEQSPMVADGDLDPFEEAARRAERASIRAMVAALRPEFSTVLILHYWEGWPLARIAEFLALPVATVKWRLYRGRRLLFCRLTQAHVGDADTKEEVNAHANRRTRR